MPEILAGGVHARLHAVRRPGRSEGDRGRATSSFSARARRDRPGDAHLETGAKLNRYIAELLGTFCLVFAGTGAIVINDVSGGEVTHVGIAITFGLIVLSLIYALGDVSGCHLNPAVTLGFFAAGRFEGRSVAPYIASQVLGAILA